MSMQRSPGVGWRRRTFVIARGCRRYFIQLAASKGDDFLFGLAGDSEKWA